MARALSIDTSFLIDLERERHGATDGPAHRLLRRESASELCLSAVALGELVEGYGDPTHPALWAIRHAHRLLPVDEGVAVVYGALTRELRELGSLIGANDLWIAATCVFHEMPIVTADVEHFGRIRGLDVVAYR